MKETYNFTEAEWNCKCDHCKRAVPHKMVPLVMKSVQLLRDFLRVPLTLTSAYRCPQHQNEVSKDTTGQHTLGTAVDIKVTSGYMAAAIISYAVKYLGVQGWAYSKKMGFVHLDWREDSDLIIWEY
jgi:zinc D-Ala-D-Ala carboxypeptidase